MAVFNRQPDPWGEETAFEQAMTQTGNARQKATKATSDATKVIAADIKEQFTATINKSEDNKDQENKIKNNEEEEKEKQELLAATRQNLKRINDEIRQAYEARIKKEQESRRVEEREKKEKIQKIEEKKQKDSALTESIKRGQGSGERAKVAG